MSLNDRIAQVDRQIKDAERDYLDAQADVNRYTNMGDLRRAEQARNTMRNKNNETIRLRQVYSYLMGQKMRG